MNKKKRKNKNLIRRAIAYIIIFAIVTGFFSGIGVLIAPEWEALAEGGISVSSSDTYMLSVTTGSSAAKGHVLYIAVDYVNFNGFKCSEYVFPTEDSLYESYLLASEKSLDENIKLAEEKAGIDIASLDTFKGETLKSHSTDEFLFKSSYPMKSIDRIRVFTTGDLEWSLQSMQVYCVTRLYGLKTAGMVSGDFYVDFTGYLMASYTGNRILTSRNDRTFFFGGNTEGHLELSNKTSSYSTGELYDRHNQPEYCFKLDIADVYGAGIEELTYNDNVYFSKIKPDERIMLKLEYRNKFSQNRTVTLPVITSAYLWMLNNSSNDIQSTYAEGFAQQGDSLIFTGQLPDCEEILKCTITYADFLEGQNWKTVTNTANSQKMDKKDSLDILSFQIYKYNKSDECIPNIYREYYSENGSSDFIYTNRIKSEVKLDVEPEYFSTADTYSGIKVLANNETNINILEWSKTDANNRVLTRNIDYSSNAYLVSIRTAEAVNCSTTSEAVLKIYYQNMNDIEICSSEYSISELCHNYYGYWPSTVGDASYLYGTTNGHSFNFIVPMTNVKNITGVSIGLKDAEEIDDWQLTGVSVSRVRNCSERYILKNDKSIKVAAGSTKWNIFRVIDAVPMYSTGERIIYLGSEIEQRNKTIKGVNEEIISDNDDVDFEKIRYSMTVADAEGILFARTRETYTVTVNVDDSLDNGTNEDSGSKNDFYFQLVFEKGSSAYVLANQQLSGDGFRPGSQSFKIRLNQNLGDVVAINIIPDNIVNENFDPTDKLNIESIDVSKDSLGGLACTWCFKNIGWIDFPYTDSGAKKTTTGAQGHTASQLAKNFLVSTKQYSVNLQFVITVGNIRGDITDFNGSLKGCLNYIDINGVERKQEFDIVEAIYQYDGVNTKYANIAKINEPEEMVAISDPNIMLQANSSDRFYVTVKDLAELKSVEITAMTPYTAQDFSIRSVAVQTINKSSNQMYYDQEGKILRDNGAVDICCTKNADDVYYMMPRATSQMREFFFSDNFIDINTNDDSWQATVDREPVSRNDTLNVFVYMKDSKNATPISKEDYTMSCYIEYTNAFGQNQRISVVSMNKSEEDGVFYLFEQSTTGLSVIKKLNLEASVIDGICSAPVDHVVVQQSRSGVVINDYYYSFSGDASIPGGLNAYPEKNVEKKDGQTVTLQLGKGTEDSGLTPELRDIAVAIKYRAKGAKEVDKEYYSKYVFLTDMGYEHIKPGMIVDFNFNESYIDEIVGVKLVATGYLNAEVEKAVCREYEKDSAGNEIIKNYISYDKCGELSILGKELKEGFIGINGRNTLVPLNISIKTMGAQADVESGTYLPVSLSIKYEKAEEDLLAERTVEELVIDDIHDYIVSGSTETGGTADIKLLINGLDSIRSITLSAGDGQNVNWSVESVKVNFYSGADESKGSRSFERLINQRMTQAKPIMINFAEIMIETNVYTVSVDGNQKIMGNARNMVNGTESFLIESGDYIEFSTYVSGSDKGYTATVSEIDAEGHSSNKSDYLTFNNNIGTFMPPANNRSENVNYVITIKSLEAENITSSIQVAVKGKPEEKSDSGSGSFTPEESGKEIDWGDDDVHEDAPVDPENTGDDEKEAPENSGNDNPDNGPENSGNDNSDSGSDDSGNDNQDNGPEDSGNDNPDNGSEDSGNNNPDSGSDDPGDVPPQNS